MTQINAPYGLQGVLEYFKLTYGNPAIYIQENGMCQIQLQQTQMLACKLFSSPLKASNS